MELEESGKIILDGREHRVRCQVAKFNFSAHADSSELKRFVSGLDPLVVVLNHGFWRPMRSLAKEIARDRLVWIPRNGITFDPFKNCLRQHYKKGEVFASRRLIREFREAGLFRRDSISIFERVIRKRGRKNGGVQNSSSTAADWD